MGQRVVTPRFSCLWRIVIAQRWLHSIIVCLSRLSADRTFFRAPSTLLPVSDRNATSIPVARHSRFRITSPQYCSYLCTGFKGYILILSGPVTRCKKTNQKFRDILKKCTGDHQCTSSHERTDPLGDVLCCAWLVVYGSTPEQERDR